MDESKFQFLSIINEPADVRKLNVHELQLLSDEIREFMIDSVSKTGGHLGAGLGVVELTVALHYVFDTPTDKLVWDVGHQAYPHKIITGRRDRMHTLRQKNGLSGFCKRTESEYDAFGAGHASTSISAALGIAAARDQLKQQFKVISITGDGAMTGGMIYEAMNNAGLLRTDLICILNDNRMSISPNQWTLHNYFAEALAHPAYNKLKRDVWALTGKLDAFGDRLRRVAQHLEVGIKATITPGMLFEALGFRYFGPVNAYNIPKLVELLSHIKNLHGPIFLHVMTEKGKGYAPAELDHQKLHGVGPFVIETGISSHVNDKPTYTEVFGKAMIEICRSNSKVIGITAAMADGTGLDLLREALPDKFYDVGIAEEHAVTFAAGMATEGMIPVCAIYSSFLQRAFDQLIHDVAIQNLHVVFAMDRSGIVGADGATHNGVFDLSYLQLIPGMVLMAPKDEQELRDMLYTAIMHKEGPIALRYPRGNAIGVRLREGFQTVPIGKAETVRHGEHVAILAIGNMVEVSLSAAEILANDGISAEVVNMRFVKPLDLEMLMNIAGRIKHILTVEDNTVVGGFGAGVLNAISQLHSSNVIVSMHGLPDQFIEQGTPAEIYREVGLDAMGIAERVKMLLKNA
jgi:1-deoxy-D-xylulose-5-phosphate synthase